MPLRKGTLLSSCYLLSTVRGAHGHVSFLAHSRTFIYTKSLRLRLIVQQVPFDTALTFNNENFINSK